jgi:hypothetical protein
MSQSINPQNWPFPQSTGVKMNLNYFAIQRIDSPDLLWSNADGWTDGEDFDLFTIQESETMTLPIDGQWVRFANIIRDYP